MSDRVTVTWTAPDTDLETAGYELRWRAATDTTDTSWRVAATIASTETSYTITELDAGTTYQVEIRTLFAGAQGDWSHRITIKTKPSPPVLSPGQRTPNSVTVTWTAPGTDSEVAGYELRWRAATDTTDTSWRMEATIASTETTYTITGLDAGVEYAVQVRVRYAGEVGGWSHSVMVETTAAAEPGTPSPSPSGVRTLSPSALGAPRATLAAPWVYQISATATTVTAFWLPVLNDAVTGFEMEWRPDSATTWTEVTGISSTATWHTITGLQPRTGYHARVRAVTDSVAGTWWTFRIGTAASVSSEPAFSVGWENTSYEEGDGEMAFILSTEDSVPQAVKVKVFVVECGTMLARRGLHKVDVGATDGGLTEVRVAIALKVDTVDEPDCVVFATLILGPGYQFGSSPTATIMVSDDD